MYIQSVAVCELFAVPPCHPCCPPLLISCASCFLICGMKFSCREKRDIARARNVLMDIIERNSIPVFSDIQAALRCAAVHLKHVSLASKCIFFLEFLYSFVLPQNMPTSLVIQSIGNNASF